MNKFIAYINSDVFKTNVRPEIKRFLAVFIFTMIYGIGVSWFLNAFNELPTHDESIYTGGIPGVAQLIVDGVKVAIGKDIFGSNGDFFFFPSIFIIVANIPVVLLGWFGVSKRFTIYSLVSVVVQATLIGFIPKLDMGLGSDALSTAVIGGLLIGIGTGGALRYGTSTGGLDIVAQYFSLKKGKSVGIVSMVLNVAIALIGGLILNSPATIAYTVIRIIISTIVIDKLHTSYQYISVDIITSSPKDMINAILEKVYRGVTLIKAEGAYSHNEKTIIYIVISSYEITTLLQIVKGIDGSAFVVTRPVKHVYGNFKRKAIA